jgi:hypothetical protein
MEEWLEAQTKLFHPDGIWKLLDFWTKYIEERGDYAGVYLWFN